MVRLILFTINPVWANFAFVGCNFGLKIFCFHVTLVPFESEASHHVDCGYLFLHSVIVLGYIVSLRQVIV